MWLDTRRSIPGTRVTLTDMSLRYDIRKRIGEQVYGISIMVPIWSWNRRHHGMWRRALAWELRNARRKMRAELSRYFSRKLGLKIDSPHARFERERQVYLAGMRGMPMPNL